jgi:phosphoserine phosphatase RsbU/P
MKIRNKLLILTMLVSLLPMTLIAGLNRLAMRRIETDVSARAYAALSEDARDYLMTIVDDYGRIMRRDGIAIALALECQTQAAERAFAKPTPPHDSPYFISQDFQAGDARIGKLVTSEDYVVYEGDRVVEMPVSMKHQDAHLPDGKGRADITPEMDEQIRRLMSLTPTYERLRELNPDVFTWQYTTLTNGLQACYPGTGVYPAEYNPLERDWYTGAIAQADQPDPSYWTRYRDALTGQVVMSASRVFRSPEGKILGVTAMDIALSKVINLLRLPADWQAAASTYIVFPEADADGKITLPVFYPYPIPDDPGDLDLGQRDMFRLASPADQKKLMAGILTQQPGVFEITWNGGPALCAFGQTLPDQPLPIVIVPRDVVVAEGLATVEAIRDRTHQALYFSGLVLAAVILLVLLSAVRQSRTLSHPIHRLADAGRSLAAGDYETNVEVSRRSGDELVELGGVFNAIGPQLQEREDMKRSLSVAREIQQHLLPQGVPNLPGLELAACGLYCDETGGDYYDFIELHNEDHVGLAVGDITGHGIAAALLMSSARAVLRSHATQYDTNLAEMFDDINRHLVRDTGDERFLTMFYGVLEASTRKLWYASGGHDPAVWYRATSGEVELLENTGPLLGAMDGLSFDQAGPITLEPGDVIAVGTDGIWEARNPAGDLFERDRFVQAVVDHAGLEPNELCQAVIRAVHDFADGHPQEDDITLIAIKAVG